MKNVKDLLLIQEVDAMVELAILEAARKAKSEAQTPRNYVKKNITLAGRQGKHIPKKGKGSYKRAQGKKIDY